MPELLPNFIGGRWTPATATAHVDVVMQGRDAFEFDTDKKVTISRWF